MGIKVTEPEIIINGKKLTDAQAATIRVALGNFSQDLYSNSLSEDDRGLTTKILYQTRIREIIRIMAKK